MSLCAWPTEVIEKVQQLRASLGDERGSEETFRLIEELRALTEDGVFDDSSEADETRASPRE